MNTEYKIGLRAIKTAIAVCICLVFACIFEEVDALFSGIAAIICMQQTYNESFRTGIYRLVGTTIGGIIGYIFLEISHLIPFYNQWINAFVIPLCLLIVIYLCNVINKKNSVVIACIVVLSILFSYDRESQSTLIYVVSRVLNTSMGIIIAMLVNKFIFPFRSKRQKNSKNN